MSIKKVPKKLHASILLVLVGAAILFSFQNCGDVGLVKPVDLGGDVEVESVKPTYLQPPSPTRNTLRAVFLVDMSASMQVGPCPNSVDTWVSQDIREQNCAAATGIDTVFNRLELIKTWMHETQQNLTAMGITDPEALKILIVPFSNGPAFSILEASEPMIRSFRGIEELDTLLLKLRVIQDCYTREPCFIPEELGTWGWSTADSQYRISTSVPGPSIADIKSLVNTEVQRLRGLNRLASSHFEFSFMSDGAAKPQIEHIEAVSKRIWQADNEAGCANMCMAELRDYLLSPGNTSPECMQCINDLRDFRLIQGHNSISNFEGMKWTWGNYYDNRIEMIFLRVHNLRLIFLENPQSSFRFNFIRMDTTTQDHKLSNYELSPIRNWLEKAKEVYAVGSHRHAVVSSTTPPFPLFTGMSGGQSYRMQSLLITNLNVRSQLPSGTAADSDGDGLTDAQEQQMGYNPTLLRSNGICSDSIVVRMNGCITEFCSPTRDEDKDSLNQCEEKTLATSDYDVDTDGDGLPDPMEVVLGYNPLVSDRLQDTNADGVSNYMQFQMGLDAMADFELFSSQDLIRHRAEFVGYTTTTNSAGQSVQVGGYRIGFKVPYRDTVEVRSSVGTGFQFLGVNQAAKNNTILVYAKIQNTQNAGDYYWIGKRFTISTYNEDQMDIDLSDMEILNVLDPTLEVQ